MDFSTKSADKKNSLQTIKTDCLVIGIYNNGGLADKSPSPVLQETAAKLYATGDIDGKAGSTLLAQSPDGIAAKRLLLVGLGTSPTSGKDFRKAIDSCLTVLKPLNVANITLALPIDAIDDSIPQTIYTIVTGFYNRAYRIGAMKKDKTPASKIRKVALFMPSDKVSIAKTVLLQAKAINEGRQYAKDLGNLPANICTPSYLAKQAKDLAKEYGFTVEILEKKQIESLKMGSFLSVARGSDEPPRFIVLKHLKGKSKTAPAVLVGKGITFDSGGISLKPGAGMK